MNQICVALDLETTGARQGREEIIEVAAVKFRGDRVLGRWESLVRPRGELPYRTQLLTGITATDLSGAPSFRDVARQIDRFVADHPLVGQSIPLDVDLLAREGLVLSNLVYDTFDLGSILVSQLPNYSLVTLAAHFGIDYPVRHRAFPDAMVSKDVFLSLYRLALELDLPVLSEMDRLASGVSWPLRHFFRDVAMAKGKNYFSTSVGAQLAAKMGLDELNLDFLVHGSRRERPAAPCAEERSLDISTLSSLLQPDGRAPEVFAGYEHREEQVTMLRAVAEAFNEGRHLIVEAGTGTGKSLAYLLPAAAWALQNNRRVLVSTNTINLQEQLLSKDIPNVERILSGENNGHGKGGELRAVLVKGRSNYICLRRWNVLRRAESLSENEVRVLIRILAWLRRTETGDRSELNLSDGELQVWAQVAAESDGCMGERCTHERRGTCMLQRVRLAAESAHLVIVNHALLLADLARSHRILPECDHVIIDEAHHLEDEATQQWGQEIGRHTFEAVLERVSRRIGGDRWTGVLTAVQSALRRATLPPETKQQVTDAAAASQRSAEDARRCLKEFFQVLSRFVDSCRTGPAEHSFRLRLTETVRARSGWAEVETAWGYLRESVLDLETQLAQLRQILAEGDGADADLEDLRIEIGVLVRLHRDLRSAVDEVIGGVSPETVCWIATDSRSGSVVCSAPLVVAAKVKAALFDRKRAAVLTGATLSTEGHFSFIRERLGLEESSELILGSPFRYEHSTLVYMVDDVPEPNKPGYQRAIDGALAGVALAAQGRTMALFTSHSALHASAAAIRPRLESADILVLAHGLDGSRRQVLTTFKSHGRAVLLGTNSFWEGVDVVGDALSVLVIAKLPFSVPTDPVFAARSELFQDAFNEYAVPRAILQFKQGFGRLIRSQSDRGVVVLLDRRLTTKQYGQAFRRSLPPCQVVVGSVQKVPSAVRAWLKERPEVAP